MILKRFIILMALTIFSAAYCLAANSINSFQGIWVNDLGKVTITNCHNMKCQIEINTVNGIYDCQLRQKLSVLSEHKAVFLLKEQYADKLINNDFVPINLSRAKQVITVTIPKKSQDIARSYCSLHGFFEGEYTNSNTQHIYKTSFNCDKANTRIDLAICHSSELAHADNVLSKLYFQLKKKQVNNIANQQREWIKTRDITCSNSIDLIQCLSDQYKNRILLLQQKSITNQTVKINHHIPYNYDYLFLSLKQSGSNSYDVFTDPPLQNYLHTTLPSHIIKNIMPSAFYSLQLEHVDDSLIMIQGATPGLYTICEGALVLSKNHQTWLAYIDVNSHNKKQITVLCPQNFNCKNLPSPLEKWVKKLLPDMDDKKIIYNNMFPKEKTAGSIYIKDI